MRTDGQSGRTDARTTQKYIPLTSSVDNKQAKSNGNIEKKTKNKKKKQLNNYAIYHSMKQSVYHLKRSDAIYAKCNKKVCLLSTHNVTIIKF